MSFALDGVRVLELARFQAGPRGGMILSDLGAEVIKIEKLGGEETRRHPPMVRGQSVYFTVYNRGKKSICLDLRKRRGQGGLRRARAEVRHRAGELPSRRHGGDGLRLRAAARAQARHHPRLGLGLRPVRPLPRPPGLRPARPGDERADDADGPARGQAARHRDVGRRPLHRAARDDRHARRAPPSRPHRRGPARRRVPARLRADDGRDPDVVLPRDRRRRAARAAARRTSTKDGCVVIAAAGRDMASRLDEDRRRSRRRHAAGRQLTRRRPPREDRRVVRRAHDATRSSRRCTRPASRRRR